MGEGDQEKKKRFDLSVSQLAGGGVATLTAATAASYLGVYGTIAGAAIMSVMSTAGTAVVQHYLKQSGETARDIAERAKRPHGPHTAVTVEPDTRGTADDVVRTQAMPVVGIATRGETVPAHSGDAEGDRDAATAMLAPVAPDGSADPGATQVLGAAGGTPGSEQRDGYGIGEEDGPVQGSGPGWWRRYRMLIIPAAVVFALVMIVILVFELFTGRTLTDTMHGTDTHSGPSLLGGYEEQDSQPQQQEPAPAPTEPGDGTGQQQTDQPEVQPSQPPAPDGGQPGGEQPEQPGDTQEPEQPDPGDGGPDDGGGSGDQDQGGSGGEQQDGAEPGARQAPVE